MGRRILCIACALALLSGLAGGVSASAQPPVTVEVTGATYTEYDARTGVWIMRGAPVVLTRGGTRVEAGTIRYESSTGAFASTGGVVVRHDALLLRAARAEGRLRDGYVLAQGEVVVTERRQDGEARLAADRVEVQLRERMFAATGRPTLSHRDARLSSERLEYDGRTETVTVTGGAELVVAGGSLRADRIEANLAEQTAEARGSVRFTGGDLAGEAPVARVDRRIEQATLAGGAVLRRGSDVLTAQTITIDLRTQRAVASGQPRLILGSGAAPRN